jgi:hypothetical protein
MVRQYSTAFGSLANDFKKAGIFDGFIEVDTKLYIDPHLLESSSAPEIIKGAQDFHDYFNGLIKILSKVSSTGDVFWRQANRRLIFKEIPQLSLGYSATDVSGSAIGPKLAFSITKTAHEIIKEGIQDPEIFELIGLLEDGIGADRISDMTGSIIIEDLLNYSQRMVTDLKLSNRTYTYKGTNYKLPFDKITHSYKILVPIDILRALPIANDWSDIDVVCQYNQTLRDVVNKLIGNTWRKATKKISKSKLKTVLINNPGALNDLIQQYKSKKRTPYNFSSDPNGELIWYPESRNFASKYPLDLTSFAITKPVEIYPLVQILCNRFKQLVENNGLNELLYNDSGRSKNERAAQLLFFGIADAYCEANNIDISREPNAGRGPVDFKVSHGYDARVTVEVKYSSNGNLSNGYSEQLKTYNIAEKTTQSIYLVLQNGEHRKKINNLYQIRQASIDNGEHSPEIIVVDARKKVSASKLRRTSSISISARK